jgi:hypothetical protein
MNAMVEKLIRVEREIAEDRGPFVLFAFLLREDAPGVWDLIVSAPWISQNESDSLKYIARRVQGVLSPEEMLKLSRIVMIEQDDPALEAIQKWFQIEHGAEEIHNSNFFGLEIKHGFIITARHNGSPAANDCIKPGRQQPELI